MGVLALVGTRKGLFLLRAGDDRNSWRVEGPMLDGWGVFHAIVDERDGTIYAAANHLVYGPTVQRSIDAGKTWRRSRQIGLPEESGLIVEATWQVQPGRSEEPGTLYLAGDPAALARHHHGASGMGRRTVGSPVEAAGRACTEQRGAQRASTRIATFTSSGANSIRRAR